MINNFPEDFAIEHDQQIYRPLCVLPSVDRNGERIRVVEWLTNCPTCGTEFTVTTGMTVRSWRRRCDRCKSPRHVKTDRKLFRAQTRDDEP